MYKRIAVAIEKAGCGTHPTDHLSFYCLGMLLRNTRILIIDI